MGASRFYAGYIHYFVIGAPSSGRGSHHAGLPVPGSPGYFPLLASRMLSEGYRPDTALVFLRRNAGPGTDPHEDGGARGKDPAGRLERDLQILEKAATEYFSRFGAFPGGVQDLVRAGLLAGVAEEPYGGEYLLSPGGRARSSRAPAERLKVLRSR
jgi:hypothetical protein